MKAGIPGRRRTRSTAGAALGGLLCLLFCTGCTGPSDTPAHALAVRWELVTNFTDSPNVFEARFKLINTSGSLLTQDNWAMFFNMAPRPIVENRAPQPASLQHINGDWYKLVPEAGFRLAPGDSVSVSYWGTEAVIKESDRPLGLYFVFYDNRRRETIAMVTDYKWAPFVRPEQIHRGAEDEVPIPEPAYLYSVHQAVYPLPPQALPPVIPTPVQYTPGDGSLDLSRANVIICDDGLQSEASYLSAFLQEITGVSFKVTREPVQDRQAIRLFTSADDLRSEAYRLEIDAEGVSITGGDAAGVFYGIQTLRALVPLEGFTERTALLPYVKIRDAPRFSYRGLHMDVSRNFQTRETVLRILDLLAFYKINRFLFYTSEDEGWRLEIAGLPELTEMGSERKHVPGKETAALHPAYGSGPYAYDENDHGSGYYSREDFIEILRYAKARHIKVIPELNFPGHARAAIKAMEARYERLMKEGKEAEANQYRLMDPADTSKYLSAQSFTDNVVSVARESTYRFYEKVVDEIAGMYAEAGLVLDEIHAGGDEVPEGAWTGSPMARSLMQEHPEIKDPKNLQAYFFRELLRRMEKRKIRVDGWEEVALTKNEAGIYEVNPEFVGQSVVPFVWNNVFDYPDLGYRLANAGYQVVLCNVSNFYFDLAYSKDPREPGLYWAGFVDTRDAWLFLPYDMLRTITYTPAGSKARYGNIMPLAPGARRNLLGLQAQLWSETIKGREMIEYYMLPKLIGFAERAWAQEQPWETIADPSAFQAAVAEDWNAFANALGQRELPRLNYLNGGYHYRIPPPGVDVRDGMLYANTEYPGLQIRYTTDGSEPLPSSPLWTAPVPVKGHVVVRCFDSSGKGGRSSSVWVQSPGVNRSK